MGAMIIAGIEEGLKEDSIKLDYRMIKQLAKDEGLL